jgi:hypothetical protein
MMNQILVTVALLAAALGCRMDQASTPLNEGDVLGGDLSEVWSRNFEMAILSDYIYQLRTPASGIITWSEQERVDF